MIEIRISIIARTISGEPFDPIILFTVKSKHEKPVKLPLETFRNGFDFLDHSQYH